LYRANLLFLTRLLLRTKTSQQITALDGLSINEKYTKLDIDQLILKLLIKSPSGRCLLENDHNHGYQFPDTRTYSSISRSSEENVNTFFSISN